MAHLDSARLQKRHQGIFPRQDVQGEASASASASAGSGFPKRVKSSQQAGPLLTTSTAAGTSTSSSQTSTEVSKSATSSTIPTSLTTRTTTSASSSSTSSSSSSIESTSSTTSSTTSTSTSTTSSKRTSSSSSSRRPLTTTSVPAQKSFAPTQTSINDVATPFIVSPSISSTDSQTLLPSETAQSSSAKGFLANKAAMAGTFSVVGLIGAGVLAVVLFTLWKKRSTFVPRSALMGGDESFKNFAMVEPEKAESSAGHDSFYSHGDHATTDLASHAPMDPFATSGPAYPAVAHYGSTSEQANPFADPTTSHNYSQQSLRDDSYLGYYTTNTDMPAPPPRGRNILARSSIQPSIDSFYGAA